MINSITFDLHGKENYILKKKYKTVLKRGKSKKKYDEAIAEFEAEEKKPFTERCGIRRRYFSKNDIYNEFYHEVEDGYENEHLIKNLKDRTIHFSQDKINIIYGANASGKTTILKAIAANAMCGNSHQFDGWTNPTLYEPLDLHFRHNEREDAYNFNKETNKFELVSQEAYDNIRQHIKDCIDKKAGNGAVLDWDGAMVYYENFAGRKSYGDIGLDFEGSIMGDLGDAMYHMIESKNISMGQNTMHLIMKIIGAMEAGISTKKTLEAAEKMGKGYNNYWYSTHKVQVDMLREMYRIPEGEKEVITFLFDEIDKSLDIPNVIYLYKNIFPDLRKRFDIQIIMISHNPIVLSTLLSPDDYNIISIDEDYTRDVKEKLAGITY